MANKSGGKAIAERLDELASTGVKGFHARVAWLTKSAAGQQALIDAGINLHNKSTRRTVLKWLADPDATASPKYRRAVDAAYAARKRQTMKASLKKRLSNRGRGTQVEVYPVDQSNVDPKKRRNLDVRRVNVRPSQWEPIVDAWAAGDIAGLDAQWQGIASDAIGSDWAAYAEVSYIGF